LGRRVARWSARQPEVAQRLGEVRSHAIGRDIGITRPDHLEQLAMLRDERPPRRIRRAELGERQADLVLEQGEQPEQPGGPGGGHERTSRPAAARRAASASTSCRASYRSRVSSAESPGTTALRFASRRRRPVIVSWATAARIVGRATAYAAASSTSRIVWPAANSPSRIRVRSDAATASTTEIGVTWTLEPVMRKSVRLGSEIDKQ